jgi:crossover junction endodeoxyribonuclease RusA
MRHQFSFEVYGKPATQGSKRALGRRGGGPIIMVESNKRLPGWRNDVAFAGQQAMPDTWPVTGAMGLHVAFRFARPKNHHTGNDPRRPLKSNAPRFHTNIAGDVDKLARAVCDALTTAGVWLDDKQVVDLHCIRVFAEPGQPEGATITVQSLEHD